MVQRTGMFGGCLAILLLLAACSGWTPEPELPVASVVRQEMLAYVLILDGFKRDERGALVRILAAMPEGRVLRMRSRKDHGPYRQMYGYQTTMTGVRLTENLRKALGSARIDADFLVHGRDVTVKKKW